MCCNWRTITFLGCHHCGLLENIHILTWKHVLKNNNSYSFKGSKSTVIKMQQKHPKPQFEQAEVIQLQARFCDGTFSLCFACPLQANQVVPPKRWTSLHMGSWYLYIILCCIWIWSSPTPPVSILIFESLASLNVSFGKGPYVWFYLEMYLGSTKCNVYNF